MHVNRTLATQDKTMIRMAAIDSNARKWRNTIALTMGYKPFSSNKKEIYENSVCVCRHEATAIE